MKHNQTGYYASKRDSALNYYRINTDSSGFPFVSRCITIDENLHVKLQFNGRSLPLPRGLTKLLLLTMQSSPDIRCWEITPVFEVSC